MTLFADKNPDLITALHKQIAVIVQSNLEDRHKIDALVELVDKCVDAAVTGQRQLLEKWWGFGGRTNQ